jgi:hypothetical protein
MGATIRKNFVFEQAVALHLEELSQSMNKSLTKVVQELIEDRYKEIDKQKKLKAAMEFAGSATGTFGELNIQEIKAEMYV